MHKLKQIKLKPSSDAFHVIQSGNRWDLFYSSQDTRVTQMYTETAHSINYLIYRSFTHYTYQLIVFQEYSFRSSGWY